MATRSSLAQALAPGLLAIGMLAALCSAAEAQSQPSALEVARAQEVLKLTMNREELLERNRAYVWPALGMGLGAATLGLGGSLYALAWVDALTYCRNGDCSTSGYYPRRERAGLVLMPLGAALILVNTPMFAIRLGRARRLERTTRRLRRLGEPMSVGASWTDKSVYARLRF